MKRIVLIVLSCFVAQTAWAGWVVTYKDAETGERSQEFYDDNKANFGDLIVTGNRYLVIDRDSMAYWKGSGEQYCNAIKGQMQKIQSMMPAQYRPKPISQRKVTRKKLGSKSIAGFSATGWEFYVDGTQEGQIWISSDSGLSDIIGYERAQMKHMKCFDDLNRAELQGAKLYKKTVDGTFVLKESGRQVVSVERKSISSSQFDVPGGYKGFSDYNAFMDYVGKHSGSSGMSSHQASPTFDMPERHSRHSASNESEEDSQQSDNMVTRDAKDIAGGAADEAHQSTKQGVQNGISDSIQEGVKDLMDKWF